MSFLYTVSVSYTSTDALMYALKVALLAAGWTVPRSGTGTSGTYNSSGDAVTSQALFTGNLKAWFVVQAPTGQARQFCFQRVGGENSYRVKYSASAGFSGGSPSANVVPSATDEIVLFGSGTDAAPSGTSWIDSSTISSQNGTYHIVCENTAPYTWIVFGKRAATNFFGAFAMDVCDNGNASDQDLAVIINQVTNGTSGPLPGDNVSNPTSGLCRAWFKYNLGGSAFQNIMAPRLYDSTANLIMPGVVGTNPYSSKDELFPVIWMRSSNQTAPSGFKGISHLFKYLGSVRSYGDTLSVASSGAKDYLHIGNGTANGAVGFVIPWNGTSPTL